MCKSVNNSFVVLPFARDLLHVNFLARFALPPLPCRLGIMRKMTLPHLVPPTIPCGVGSRGLIQTRGWFQSSPDHCDFVFGVRVSARVRVKIGLGIHAFWVEHI